MTGAAVGAAAGRTMTVVACTASGETRLEQRPVPSPGPGELLLELRCCGLCGTDLFKLEHATAAAGTVLGHELVGTVVAPGSGVERFTVGQRVVAPHHVACGTCALCRRGSGTQCPAFRDNLLEPGGFAEFVLVRRRAVERAAWLVPDQVSDAAAAFLEPAACVLRGVDKAGLDDREGCALVLGAGAMGLLHLLLLRACRPGLEVVVSDLMAERRELALQLGARAACGDDPGELARVVRSVSDGVGADAVFDTVGGSPALALGLGVLRPGGVVVLFAHAGAGEQAGFELNPFFKTEQRLAATYSGTIGEQRQVAELLACGRFDPAPLVTHRLPLSRFSEALSLAQQRAALKILIHPEGG